LLGEKAKCDAGLKKEGGRAGGIKNMECGDVGMWEWTRAVHQSREENHSASLFGPQKRRETDPEWTLNENRESYLKCAEGRGGVLRNQSAAQERKNHIKHTLVKPHRD